MSFTRYPVVAFQKALHRLRPRDGTKHPRYFYYSMRFAHAAEIILADQDPNEIPHLTGEELRRYRFPKPPLQEQVAIAAYLDDGCRAWDVLIGDAQRMVTLLQERRAALIHAAVTGQIDVRNLPATEAP